MKNEKVYYVAGFVPEDGGYVVYFPDFPAIATEGDTLQEATENASDALRVLLETMTRDNDAIPEPSDLAQVREQVRAVREGDGLPYPDDTVYQLVLAPNLDATPVRINISVPKGALMEIDEKAKAAGFSRSAYLTHAAQNYHA